MGLSLKSGKCADSMIDVAYKNVLRDFKVTRDIIKSELKKKSITVRNERGRNEIKTTRPK